MFTFLSFSRPLITAPGYLNRLDLGGGYSGGGGEEDGISSIEELLFDTGGA